MKIIRHGNLRGDTIEFTCACGCVFLAEHNEYKVLTPDEGFYKFYKVNCPECDEEIVIEASTAKRADGWL